MEKEGPMNVRYLSEEINDIRKKQRAKTDVTSSRFLFYVTPMTLQKHYKNVEEIVRLRTYLHITVDRKK